METLNSGSDGLTVDLSALSNSNLIDLRGGSFSSINTKAENYNAQYVSADGLYKQTFYNFNNVGLAYHSSIKSLTGGSGSDVVYVSNYDVSIDGGSGVDKVYLPGDALNWTRTEKNQSESDYSNGSTTVRLNSVESVGFYKSENVSLTHSRVDLLV